MSKRSQPEQMDLPTQFTRMVGVHSAADIWQLQKARVAIVGMGCDGCEVAEQLARSGVGELTIMDDDLVEETNLNRQRLYEILDIGIPKVWAAARRLKGCCPAVKLNVIAQKLWYDNAEVLRGHDVIVQGLDNVPSRIALHEIAREMKTPLVTMSGQPPLRTVVSTVLPGGPLYQELFNIEMPEAMRSMSLEARKRFHHCISVDRARHAVSRGADRSWFKQFEKGKAGWPITLGRSPITGTMQSNEVIRLLLGQKPLAVAPNIIAYDGNGLDEFGFPDDLLKVLKPRSKDDWDYKLF